MVIKYSVQGFLIYLAMVFYLLGFLVSMLKFRRFAILAGTAGFVAAFGSAVYRWTDAGHVPLGNLFEMFIFLGMVVWPIYFLCERVFGIKILAGDYLVGAMILFPAGFVFSGEPLHLPPVLQSWLFIPHVGMYMGGYVLLAKAGYYVFGRFFEFQGYTKSDLANDERACYKLACLGFPFLSFGLVLGSIWARDAWGRCWGWDPKEMWSLATWLVYMGYFHFRYGTGGRFPGWNYVWLVFGFVFVLITLLWANLSSLFAGLHSYA